VPPTCPACGSAEIARIGAGTQRLESELAKHVPELERFRLDADVATRPGAARDAFARFREADRAVLVGTQMVAKGHHVPGVSLAAVVDADTSLGLPDFRAEERTFQLVTQLAGRSGRDAPGRVLVQTFQPDATPLRHAVNHDVAAFSPGSSSGARLGYPPFRHLVSILVSGPEPGRRSLRSASCASGSRARGRPARPAPCCGSAGATAPSSSRRRRSPGRSRATRRLLAAAARDDAPRRAHRRGGRRPAVAVDYRVDESAHG
jgi:primosomal protein N'